MNSKLNQIQNWPEMLRQANWKLSEMAKHCGVSLRALERYLLRKFGKCPRAWLAEMRMRQAVELLRDGSNVKEVAAVLGYKHPTHFSRAFTRHWGHSPIRLSRMPQPDYRAGPASCPSSR